MKINIKLLKLFKKSTTKSHHPVGRWTSLSSIGNNSSIPEDRLLSMICDLYAVHFSFSRLFLSHCP